MWKRLKLLRKDNSPIVLFGSEPFSSYLRMSNIKEYKYDWIWSKNRGTGIFSCNKMPMKSHEVISIFYKKQPLYNPQMRDGNPYVCKQGKKQSEGFGLNTEKEIITINNGGRYPLTVLKYNSTNGKNVHPTQKPVELIEYLIKTYTNEGDTVLDFTMGSGTTGVACIKTNRNFIGIEFNPEKDKEGNLLDPAKYFNIAIDRIKKESEK